MKKIMKSFISMLLAFIIAVSIFPSAVSAEVSFNDVKENDYFYKAVTWAVENRITSGLTETSFGPNSACTRAQAVTFMWRAEGSPEPKSKDMPFTDVPAGIYYYKAVQWAVEKNITAGLTPTVFGAEVTCSRAQIVTFLWRSQGSPAVNAQNPFEDVPNNIYYTKPVLWAVQNKITAGLTATMFSPDSECTRAQIVSFLYRYDKNVASVNKLHFWKTPDNIYVQPGDTAKFDAEVSGGQYPYSVKWEIQSQNEWVDVKELGNAQYMIDEGYGYTECEIKVDEQNIDWITNEPIRCVVTDAEGTQVIYDKVDVKRGEAFKFLVQPEDVIVNIDDEAVEFHVEATGGMKPYTYEWQTYNDGEWKKVPFGSDVYFEDEKQTMYLFLAEDDWSTQEEKRCVVTDAAGVSIISDTFWAYLEKEFSVDADQLWFYPTLGSSVTMQVKATGGKKPYTYKWLFRTNLLLPYDPPIYEDISELAANGEFNAVGYDTDKLTVKMPVDSNRNEGGYIMWPGSIICEVTDAHGTTKKIDFRLSEGDNLRITENISNQYAVAGEKVSFSIETEGGVEPLTYQWYWKNDVTEEYRPFDEDSEFHNGIHTNQLTILTTESIFNRHYFFYCKVTDANGASVQSHFVQIVKRQ